MYLFCVFILVLASYLYYCWRRKYKDLNSFPGPPGLPIVGNLYDVGNNTADMFKNLNDMTTKYGEIFRMWIGPFYPTLVVSDPKYVELILSSNVHIKKSSTYEIFHTWLKDGLITINDPEAWRKHRKLLTPAFHFKILERFIHTFHRMANVLIEKLGENIDSEGFDIYPFINRYTLDVICESSMGVQLDIQNNADHEYLRNLSEYQDILVLRQFSLTGRKENLYKYSPNYKKCDDCVKQLKQFTEEVIKEKHKKWQMNKSMKSENEHDEYTNTKEPFLDLLFAVLDRGGITMEEIRQEVDTFMFAGHDTTSAAIGFALFELSKHPDIQEKILEEINENIGEGDDQPFTIANLQSLKYLECVCKEAMRLYSVVPYIERGVQDHLEIDGKVIPKGTSVTIFIHALHNNAKYYKNPEEFIPERFLAEVTAKKDPFTFVPFSAGPRNCIGQRFAMLEYKATVAEVIKNFVLLPVEPQHRPVLAANTILKSHNGMYVKIKPRIKEPIHNK